MKKSLFWLYALSAGVYFSQGIEGLSSLPVFFYFKETLNFDEARIMFLSSLISLAWVIKPVWGHLVDNWGLSKKTWILLSLVGTILISGIIGLLPTLSVLFLVGLMALSSGCGALRDVSADGLMVVEGKKAKTTGRIQSLQWIALTIASVLTGFCGGYISEHYSYQMAFLFLIPVYLVIVSILTQYKDVPKLTQKKTHIFNTMKVLVTDKKLLLVCLVIFLYKFSPSFGVPLNFIIRDNFHWSKIFMGVQDTISSIVSIGGALLYYKYSKHINVMKWLKWSVFLGATTTLAYLYFTPVTAIVYNVIFSFMGMFITLLLLDFMARHTRSGFEAVSFALLCSVSNLANTANGFVGSYLFPIVGLKWLIVISAVASFSVLLVIPVLQREEQYVK